MITKETSNLIMELALEILVISIHKVSVRIRRTLKTVSRKFADDRWFWKSSRKDGMLGCEEKREDIGT